MYIQITLLAMMNVMHRAGIELTFSPVKGSNGTVVRIATTDRNVRLYYSLQNQAILSYMPSDRNPLVELIRKSRDEATARSCDTTT